MMSMAEVEMEDGDDTVTKPLTRENLPRFSLRTGVTFSNVDIEPLTEPVATARRLDGVERDEWSAWTSPTTRMNAMPPRSETTVTRPMLRVSNAPAEAKQLPPVPQAPRPKLESGLRPLTRDSEPSALPPVPRVPAPALQSDVPLPRPRPRLASVGLRPLAERAPALPTPPMFPVEAAPATPAPKPAALPSYLDDVEVAPAFRIDPAPLATMHTASPPPAAPVSKPSPPPMTISAAPSAVLDRFESSQHTKRTTLPPMQHAVGLPVVQGFQDFPRPLPSLPAPSLLAAPALRPQPIPWLQSMGASKVLSSPFFLLAFAVSLVAMSVLGFAAVASAASESRRAARTRVITASDIAGTSITDATAYVDGSPACTSLPCSVVLKDGAHWITVRAANYDTPPSRAVRTSDKESKSVHFGLTRPSNIPLPAYTSAPVVTVVPVAPVAPTALPTVPPAQPAIAAIAPESAPPVAVGQPVASPIAPAPAPVAAAPAPLSMVPAPAAPASTDGTLNINSLPVSNVLLDGRPLGQTPKLRVKVKPGNHSVMFIYKGKRTTRGARVGAGESVTVSVRL